MWIKWQDRMPEIEQPVLCLLKNDNNGKQIEQMLIHVNADDHTWVTVDDRAELNEWTWSVIGWKSIN